MSPSVSSPRQLFADEIARAEPDLDLARAALLVAREQYPQLPVERYLGRLDALAEQVRDRLDNETAPLLVLQELTHTVYGREGMRGNRDAYYDPRNSFLNDVLDRRLGIPLTLAIVLLEVGWRLGLPVEGVDFPDHFLVRYRGEESDLLLDPFDGGRVRFEDQAQELLDRAYGGRVRVRESFLRRASKRDMLTRMLGNLKAIYVKSHDHAHALSAVERMLLLRPDAALERRARGILLARLGRSDEAIDQLEAYLGAGPEATDAEHLGALVRRLRSGEDPCWDAAEP